MPAKFSQANSKLKKLYKVAALQRWLKNKRKIYSFDLLSGYSCAFADRCLSLAIETNGTRKIQDGPNTEFRCFSASAEVVYTNVYKLRKSNFAAVRNIKTVDEMVSTLESAMPENAGIVRWGVAGDIFNQTYMDSIIEIANNHNDRLFYAYTKALPFWVKRMNDIPDNLVLTASDGGRMDSMIKSHNLRYAIVVPNQEKADELGLEVDDDDSHACIPEKRHQSFALIIHGTQPRKRE